MGIVSLAVIKLSLIALLGAYLYKKKIITEDALRFLTILVINFTIPALIFSHLIDNSQIVLNQSLWIFIALSISIFLIGYILGFIFSFKKTHEFKKEFTSLVSFQNSGYLPLNIALFLFPPALREEFLVYIVLNLLGFNIIMWSVGSFFIFKKKGERFKLKSIFTPPITSTLFALLLIYTHTAQLVPAVIRAPVRMVGDVSFVLSMLVLGSWLAKIKLKGLSKRLFYLGEVSFLKLMVLPFLFLIAVLKFEIFSLFGLFIVLQAAMPSAASLPIIANLRDADSEFTSQGVFLTHLLSIFTITFWLTLYLKLSGFSL
jgi:predicted permease